MPKPVDVDKVLDGGLQAVVTITGVIDKNKYRNEIAALRKMLITFSELQHLLAHVNKHSLQDAIADHAACMMKEMKND